MSQTKKTPTEGDTGHGTVTTVHDIEAQGKAQAGEAPGSAGKGYSNAGGQRICNRCNMVFLSDGEVENHIKSRHEPQEEKEIAGFQRKAKTEEEILAQARKERETEKSLYQPVTTSTKKEEEKKY